MESIDDPRLKLIAKVVAVLLLSSYFAPSRVVNTSNMSATWFHGGHVVGEKGGDLKLVSSLRQHMQWIHAPAHGHHARSNSVVSLRQDKEHSVAREDLLAEEISRKRLSRRGGRRYVEKRFLRNHSNHEPEQIKRRNSPYLYHRASPDGNHIASVPQHADYGCLGRIPTLLDSYTSMNWTTAASIDSVARPRDVSNHKLRLSPTPMFHAEESRLCGARERIFDVNKYKRHM